MSSAGSLWFVATGKGFLRTDHPDDPKQHSWRTKNVRFATPFESYVKADNFFKAYCAANGAEYYAVLRNNA